MIPDALQQDPVVAALVARFPNAVLSGHNKLGELTLDIAAANLVEVCRILKDEHKFVRLSSVTAVDWYPRDPRFETVCHLQSIERNTWLRLKSEVPQVEPGRYEIDSLYPVWRSANWYEREVFDLFGIHFRNHPNLTRIMLPDDWKGHPLRKDYPVHGYKYSYAEQE